MNVQYCVHYAFYEAFLYFSSVFEPAEHLRHSYPLYCLPVLQKPEQNNLSQLATILRLLKH